MCVITGTFQLSENEGTPTIVEETLFFVDTRRILNPKKAPATPEKRSFLHSQLIPSSEVGAKLEADTVAENTPLTKRSRKG